MIATMTVEGKEREMSKGIVPDGPITTDLSDYDTPNHEDSEIPELMKLKDVAKYLKIGERALCRWIKEGRLKVIRLSATCIRVDARDLDDFIQSHKVPAISEENE